MSDISKTKCQELKLTGLLTTFLCNYSKYTNFVLDRVHEPLDIWSAANCWVRAGLEAGMGWTTTILRSYTNYSCKLSLLFQDISMFSHSSNYFAIWRLCAFWKKKSKRLQLYSSVFLCLFSFGRRSDFGKNIDGFRNQARHFLNQNIKFDNLTTRTLVCREASGIMASVPVSCLFQACSLDQFNSGR